jgi:hypothetical protein
VRANDWERFDPTAYVAANYRSISDADRWIAEALLGAWGEIGVRLGGGLDAIDVGAGPNLYPALVALPSVRRLSLIEYSKSNRRYLEAQREELGPDWEEWLGLLEALAPETHGSANLRSSLVARVEVRQGDIFALPEATVDVGQMFFCAESITRNPEEFVRACRCFAEAVRPGGELLAAFMTGSTGYATAGPRYPAVPIGAVDVRAALAGLCEIRRLESVPGGGNVRDGHEGMLFLAARRGSDDGG